MRSIRPRLEVMEPRALLTTVLGLAEQFGVGGQPQLLISFSAPLNPTSATNVVEYSVQGIAVTAASYTPGSSQVTLSLGRQVPTGRFTGVRIFGGLNGLRGADGQLVDGDNDQTPGGDYRALFGRGRSLRFTDFDTDRASVNLTGPGTIELTRLISGQSTGLNVVGGVAGRTAISGKVIRGPLGNGIISIPSLTGMAPVTNNLSPQIFNAPRPPALASQTDLPFSIRIEEVTNANLLTLQSQVTAQASGDWLVFGGRTNGLHSFDSPPSDNFPVRFQNRTIQVVDPATGHVWSTTWAASGLPASVTDPLSSVAQQAYQKGDTLYVTGGYGQDKSLGSKVTFPTLTAIDVPGMINAIKQGGSLVPYVRQITDERVRVTGGDMDTIGDRTYLVFGQDFEGEYTGASATTLQVYTDQVRSFQIVDGPGGLGIANYQTQTDPVNFRRRDGNLAATIDASGRPGLTYYGGVFTPAGAGYLNPVTINDQGVAQVDTGFQQFFSNYTSPVIPIYSKRMKSLNSVFVGGIGIDHYNPTTGVITSDSGLPWTPDITTQVHRANGLSQENIMLPQLPGFYGGGARFLQSEGLSTYKNGVIKLDGLKVPTTLGYMYGGIYSSAAQTGGPGTFTTASSKVFRIILVPKV